MNDPLNNSTETPHLDFPHSCIHSSLRQDKNSFSSFRAGSVTSKRSAHNCLSPKSIKTLSDIPMPIKTLSRAKKQSNEVKKILKKNTKTSNYCETFSPKVKRKVKIENNLDKVQIFRENLKALGRDDSPKSFVDNESKSNKIDLKLKKFSKKEGKNKDKFFGCGFKIQKKVEKMINLDFEKLAGKRKVVKEIVVDTKLLTPRSKIEEKIRKSNKKHKRSEAKSYSSHKNLPIDLSKVLQINTTPKLSPNAESSTLSLKKRNSDSIVKRKTKKTPKNKQKHSKKLENFSSSNKNPPPIQKPDSNPVSSKPPKFKPMQRPSNDSSIKQTLQLLLSEPDITPPKTPISSNSSILPPFTNKDHSATLIQSHIRRYLAQKKYKLAKDMFSCEDNEVISIISGIKIDSNKQQKLPFMTDFKIHNEEKLDSLQKLRSEELLKIQSVIKESKESSQAIETITKIINSRYQNIAKIMQAKYEVKHGLDSELLSRISEDSESYFEKSESFSDSCSEDKVWINTYETAANTKENSVTPSMSDSKLELTENWTDPDLHNCPLNPSPKHSKIITSESVTGMTERILEQFLSEEIDKYAKPANIDTQKDQIANFDCLLQGGIDFILKRFDKIDKTLSRPLRKNPLEVLARVQSPYTVNPLNWCFTGFPNVIPPGFCDEFRSGNVYDVGFNRHQTKMFFDCCNEVIQQMRPFGESGAPMPWSVKKPEKSVKIHKKTFKKFLTEKIESFNSVCAGKIPNYEFFTGANLDEEEIHKNREEKIAVLIGEDIKQDERVWVDYEFECTQASITLADIIFEALLYEVAGVISNKIN